MSNIEKYDGTTVSPVEISRALDDNGAYVKCGTLKLVLEAVEKDQEVLSQKFVIYVSNTRVFSSEDEDLAITTFLECLEG